MVDRETKYGPFGALTPILLFASACFSWSCGDGCVVSWHASSGSTPSVGGPFAAGSGQGAQLANEARRVSLVQLIATPEAYRGERVQVVGYVAMEFEGNAVYLHRDDFMQGIVPNGLWIDLQDAKGVTSHDSGYAILEGRFNPDKKGHMALFSGAIEQVERLSILPSRDKVDPSGKKP